MYIQSLKGMHNFRSSGEYDNDCTTPLTPLCTQPEQVIKGKCKNLPTKPFFLSEGEIPSCVCRGRQYHPVPHSERQETHSHQRHQQQRGLLGRFKGKHSQWCQRSASLLSHSTAEETTEGDTLVSAEQRFKLIINSLL